MPNNNHFQRRNTNLTPWEAHQRTLKGWQTKHREHPNSAHFNFGTNFVDEDDEAVERQAPEAQRSISESRRRQAVRKQRAASAPTEKQKRKPTKRKIRQSKITRTDYSRNIQGDIVDRDDSVSHGPREIFDQYDRPWEEKYVLPGVDPAIAAQSEFYDFLPVDSQRKVSTAEDVYKESGHRESKGWKGIQDQAGFVREQYKRLGRSVKEGEFTDGLKVDWDTGKVTRAPIGKSTVSIGPNREYVYKAVGYDELPSDEATSDPHIYARLSNKPEPAEKILETETDEREHVPATEQQASHKITTETETKEVSGKTIDEILNEAGIPRQFTDANGNTKPTYTSDGGTGFTFQGVPQLKDPQKRRALQRSLEKEWGVEPKGFQYMGPGAKERHITLPGGDNYTKIEYDDRGPHIGRDQIAGQEVVREVAKGPHARLGLRSTKSGELLPGETDVVGTTVPGLRPGWGNHLIRLNLGESTDDAARFNRIITALPRAHQARLTQEALDATVKGNKNADAKLTAAVKNIQPNASSDEVEYFKEEMIRREMAALAHEGLDEAAVSQYINKNYDVKTPQDETRYKKELMELGAAGGAATLYTGTRALKNRVVVKGVNKTVRDVSNFLGVKDYLVRNRILRKDQNLLKDITWAAVPVQEKIQEFKYGLTHPLTDPSTGVLGINYEGIKYRDRFIEDPVMFSRRAERREKEMARVIRTKRAVDVALDSNPSRLDIPARVDRAITLRAAHTMNRNENYATELAKKRMRNELLAVRRAIVLGKTPTEGDRMVIGRALGLSWQRGTFEEESEVDKFIRLAQRGGNRAVRAAARHLDRSLLTNYEEMDRVHINPERLKPYEKIGWGFRGAVKPTLIGVGALGATYGAVRLYDAYQERHGGESLHNRVLPNHITVPRLKWKHAHVATIPENKITKEIDLAKHKIDIPYATLEKHRVITKPSLRKDASGDYYRRDLPLVGNLKLHLPNSQGSIKNSLTWDQLPMGGRENKIGAETGNYETRVGGKQMPVRVFVGKKTNFKDSQGRTKLKRARKRDMPLARELDYAMLLKGAGEDSLIDPRYQGNVKYQERLEREKQMAARDQSPLVRERHPMFFMDKQERQEYRRHTSRDRDYMNRVEARVLGKTVEDYDRERRLYQSGRQYFDSSS